MTSRSLGRHHIHYTTATLERSHSGNQTHDLLIARQTPYPLHHWDLGALPQWKSNP
ncbi:hypothetical protein DPMN_191619 [Dreissena polymorpha]|uniref:Uncharacterized protein n=1 Tax=Dreissena polymorpha TaxID=45954 RepID=A0A9D3Y5R4_DREPO|nr:hypothetical protein DPMN_191619 [Dreissena polymorpha]